eukprot:GSMAST32.ASY1.ANO1.1310.1 assembled CDS
MFSSTFSTVLRGGTIACRQSSIRNSVVRSLGSNAAAAASSTFEGKVPAKLVKDLRERTGAPLLECRNALREGNLEIQAAVEYLRKIGMATAAKKAGRTTSEGLVGVMLSDCETTAVSVEVNSETDFVSRNELFQNLVDSITTSALISTTIAPTCDSGELEKPQDKVSNFIKSTFYSVSGEESKDSIESQLKEAVATLGENLTISRVSKIAVNDPLAAGSASKPGTLGIYVHVCSPNPNHEFRM